MSLTVAEFERGVAYWLEQTKWDRDFHNGFYKTMAAVNPHGKFDDSWWAGFLPELHRWRATRSRSGDFLTPRVRPQRSTETEPAVLGARARRALPHAHRRLPVSH